MRHRVHKSRLNRQNSHRKATVNSLVQNLFRENRIQTTLPKAKVASQLADTLITIGKREDLSAQRQAFKTLQSRELVHRLFHTLSPLFVNRNGGYTRIVKLMPRKGDAAPMALLELVEIPLDEEPKEKPEAKENKEEKQPAAEEGKKTPLKGLKKYFNK